MIMEHSNLVENYAQFIVDGMDYKTLEQYAYDCLVEDFIKNCDNDEELAKEIVDLYDQETLDDLKGESNGK